jgi:5,10-methylenetetrahydromethanopterin reductase
MPSSQLQISRWAGSGLRHVDDVVRVVQQAADDGFDGVWVPQTTSVDTLTALAVAARAVPGIPVGTAVVPIQGRHPIPLAQQALTVAQAAGPGRVTLGIGVTHRIVSEGFYGIPYGSTVAMCEEELEALRGLLSEGRSANLNGRWMTARAKVDVDGPAPGLVVAALGPRMLEIAGRLADGTVTWMTGFRSLRDGIVPGIRRSAEQADRPDPRIIVGLPVCVSDDVAGARDRLRPAVEGAMKMPSYQRMMAAEALDDPAEIGIVGTEDAVAGRIAELASLGATELLANVVGDADEQARTVALLGSLAGRK